jgi:hypothetical protein
MVTRQQLYRYARAPLLLKHCVVLAKFNDLRGLIKIQPCFDIIYSMAIQYHPCAITWMVPYVLFFAAEGMLQQCVSCVLVVIFSGAPAMTSRGLVEKDFEQIGQFLHQAVTICLNIQKEYGKLLKDFNKGLVNNKDIENLRAEVEKFADSFDMPGFTLESMKYKE